MIGEIVTSYQEAFPELETVREYNARDEDVAEIVSVLVPGLLINLGDGLCYPTDEVLDVDHKLTMVLVQDDSLYSHDLRYRIIFHLHQQLWGLTNVANPKSIVSRKIFMGERSEVRVDTIEFQQTQRVLGGQTGYGMHGEF